MVSLECSRTLLALSVISCNIKTWFIACLQYALAYAHCVGLKAPASLRVYIMMEVDISGLMGFTRCAAILAHDDGS